MLNSDLKVRPFLQSRVMVSVSRVCTRSRSAASTMINTVSAYQMLTNSIAEIIVECTFWYQLVIENDILSSHEQSEEVHCLRQHDTNSYCVVR